ncbi:hypothetical protein [Heyndrickxia sporothermodurans]|uniref:hypothetical protein n=1 Tax=Heyndrickxia sporothermodurans TaxID=46224 RepID=UPI0036A60C50
MDQTFYEYLENEDLILGLHFLVDFFQKDTFLIKNKRNLLVNIGQLENEQFYNQTTFAKYLSEHGLNYSPTKLGTYYRREKNGVTNGKFPLEDILINGTPYWYESTVDLFTRELLALEKEKTKKKKTNKKKEK